MLDRTPLWGTEPRPCRCERPFLHDDQMCLWCGRCFAYGVATKRLRKVGRDLGVRLDTATAGRVLDRCDNEGAAARLVARVCDAKRREVGRPVLRALPALAGEVALPLAA